MKPVAVFVGPPGAGKTTVASRVARALGVALRDTDHDIEANAGKSVADIFVEEGEPVFRELEVAAVAQALAEHEGERGPARGGDGPPPPPGGVCVPSTPALPKASVSAALLSIAAMRSSSGCSGSMPASLRAFRSM